MNILWIEDFGKRNPNEQRVTFVKPFGDFTKSIEKRLEELGESQDDTPGSLREILRDNTHPILWYDGFPSGLNAIMEKSFDFVILDADLPINTIEAQWRTVSATTKQLIDEFRKKEVFPNVSLEAGFTLYFYLVQEQGFPRDRVVFLSANAIEAQGILKKFGETKAIPPKIFSKNDQTQVEEFRETLKKFSENEHLNLRRGMLDMLDQIEKQSLSTKPPFDEKNDDPINVTAFVNGLRFLLNDHRIPSSEKDIQRFYLVLCDYLTKPFERFSIESLSRGLYRWKVGVSKEYVMPAYFMRNWIAHDVMNNSHSQLSAKDVSFIFIIVIKSLFNHSCLEAFKTLYAVPDKPIDLIGLLAELHEKNYSSPPRM